MRSDLHRLFDEGYMTLDPGDRRVVVSRRIREEFDNGKDYYKLVVNWFGNRIKRGRGRLPRI